jgi:lipopolysaccharide export system ATP-binding protein|uniref:Probable ATP-dependent transporter ycf16 n=2 Tax=Cyanidioschyzon merolae TaxID=45157 RepID=Q85G78_CYAM1|nr:sulfate ABC transporter protein [Cyanidioschyzon merolae strain 10D]QFV16930.1 putative ABC transporter ATP-binding protein YhbG-like protein [Cyanidioschyzon merolae]QFV17109.1 putative ABC transporter ATP-binding protein YhbG-like protein [Cyanidioschyzon merolae]BAC76112.1 probable ABC transporter ATP-binding protein YhbG homolog [Cyanidioschyzon merolae strain 10D]
MRLIASQISHDYGNHCVLKGITVSVKQGEIVALLGVNGAGKTTLFNIIAGVTKVTQGEIWMGQQFLSHMHVDERAQLGLIYLPQQSSLFSSLTVAQNLSAHVLSLFDLQSLSQQVCSHLSGGERKRVELAKAVSQQAKFLLLDEPFAAVDPKSLKLLQNTIKRLKEWKIGVMITDHHAKETLQIVDRAYVLFEGHILAKGNSTQLWTNSLVKQTYLG